MKEENKARPLQVGDRVKIACDDYMPLNIGCKGVVKGFADNEFAIVDIDGSFTPSYIRMSYLELENSDSEQCPPPNATTNASAYPTCKTC